MLEQVADSSNLNVKLINDGSSLENKLIQSLKDYTPGLEVIIDYSTESNYYIDKHDNILIRIHEILDELEIPAENVSLYTGSLVIDRAYERFKELFQSIKPLKNVAFKDFWLKQTVKVHTDYSQNYNSNPKPIHFSCLNGAERDHRIYTLEYLIEHNLFTSGVCTFVWKGISVDGKQTVRGILSHGPQAEEFYKVFDDTYYDFITETNTGLNYPHTWWQDVFFTEKTWRSIYYKRPFILQGNYKSLHYLKQLGFKTFDGILFDESYDNEPDHKTRIFKTLDENKRVVQQLSLSDLHEIMMSQEMADILQHNYEMINNMAKQDIITVSTLKNTE
jgi:hypothetical protein